MGGPQKTKYILLTKTKRKIAKKKTTNFWVGRNHTKKVTN